MSTWEIFRLKPYAIHVTPSGEAWRKSSVVEEVGEEEEAHGEVLLRRFWRGSLGGSLSR